jgi:uncharacterized protein YqeY
MVITLKERIREDYINAFKNKRVFEKTFLSTIVGEIQTMDKNVEGDISNEDVIKILTKFKKSTLENINSGVNGSGEELEILNRYLPKELGEVEIREIVERLVESGVNNIGLIMKEFAGLVVDRSKVSKITKEILG